MLYNVMRMRKRGITIKNDKAEEKGHNSIFSVAGFIYPFLAIPPCVDSFEP